MPHIFSFSLSSESNPFEISRVLSLDFKDQALWRKWRSGSTDLSFISFYFPFPLLSLISERNTLYCICSQSWAVSHQSLAPCHWAVRTGRRTVVLLFSWLLLCLAPSTRAFFLSHDIVQQKKVSGILIILVLWYSSFQL